MKAVILAGGLGTRLSEETSERPKPMVEIGGRPLLWHIMSIYSAHGINDFIVCGGYKSYMIAEYFANYFLHVTDVTVDLGANSVEVHRTRAERWRVTVVDTGAATMTGGRLLRVGEHLGDESFCMTYGDGVADVDITKLIASHNASGLEATVTAVRPPGRFGALDIADGRVRGFVEKPLGDGSWINGGFFVLNSSVLKRVEGDATVWEGAPLSGLAADRQLNAYLHQGFWQPMDTLRDKRHLEELWSDPAPPWKVW